MFERLTASAREVVAAARREAAQLGHQYIGTEHLLYGLLLPEAGRVDESGSSSHNPAATVLEAADIAPSFVRSEILRLAGSGAGGLGESEADALHSIGIDLDAVRSKLEDSFGQGVLDQPRGGPRGGRVPMTKRARKALGLSLREARRLGSDHVGPEHILLGLIDEGQGIAAQILAAKVPLGLLRDRLLEELSRAA